MQVSDMFKKAKDINIMLKNNNARYCIEIRWDRVNRVYDIYIVLFKTDGFTTEFNDRYYFSGNIKEICIELDNIHYFLDITLNRKDD